MLRVQSQLSIELEDLIHRTIGCCIAVHRAIGPGFGERIYNRALCIELTAEGIPFEREKRFSVFYRGHLLGQQRVDLLIGAEVVLEIKSVDRVAAVHRAQLLRYLRVARLRAGLLVNFNVAVLPDGLQRIVL